MDTIVSSSVHILYATSLNCDCIVSILLLYEAITFIRALPTAEHATGVMI
jgi:hypothetical protein